ncbi:hypothetical protein [Streptomyces hesseae]|uniref:DUF3558 domain-containing protein n=1 Tax=Streptomyces hesseae TaxID=3075519 RepID=A0ABU2SJ82_9ACTN|nr:hypothetical protein [Streptomyces sp. DSM 40473]MDT0449036.1 hypothetical protein [Streptomyces sp. DSM 40473]
MQRRAYAPVAALASAAVLSAVLTGCGGGSGSGGGGEDPKPGSAGSSTAAAEPGKYHSLPEPCGYVSRDTLRRMLPGVGDGDEEEAKRLLQGQAAITYDTDRRVGCRWKLETPNGTRHLSVDFERVVSYQPGMSDENRAKQLYQREATAAHIPNATPAPTTSASPGGSPGGGSPPASAHTADPGPGPQLGDATVAPMTPSAPPSADPKLAPRVLDDLGDDAFVDDKLATTGSGVHRDVKVVFRSSNVLVTIAYDQWTTDALHIPSSLDLQGKAHGLARELDAGHFGN